MKDNWIDDELFPGDPPSWCNGHEYWALTEDRGLPQASVTICPASFVTPKFKDTLVDVANPALGTPLDNVQVKSLTLLHELFHLLGGLRTRRILDVSCNLG